MKKRLLPIFAAALLLVSCSSPAIGDIQGMEQGKTLYFNLADEGSKNEVIGVLQRHGIAPEQTDTLLAWINDFNGRVTSPALPEGFTPMEGDLVDYSGLLFDYKELADGSLFPDANCRLTAFMLMQKHIQTKGTANENDTYLMFDIEAIDTQGEYALSEKARTDFITLFNAVPLAGAENQEEHQACLEKAWRDRGIQVDTSTSLSLIEVYLHSTFDDVRFVGHVGVLIDTAEGLLFVEKYGPEAPFQATKFSSRNALEHYLLARPDLYGDDTELPPIIMENGRCMDPAQTTFNRGN